MKKIDYNFDENSPPKEIINSILIKISELLKPYGFKFLKSKSEIIKRTDNFVFSIYSQSNRWNSKGESAEIKLHCSVSDKKDKSVFWRKTLALSNSKKDQHNWLNFYGQENYKKNLFETINVIESYLIVFYNKFENDLQNLVNSVSENGFCAFGDKQVYDAGYYIPIKFLSKYGSKEQLNKAFQNYIDRHELNYVKPNMRNAIELLKNGKEVKNNGEDIYAKFAVENELELKFD